MLTDQDIQQMGQLPSAEREKLQLAPGDDVENSPWRNLTNVRLQVEGSYIFWKTRGGSTVVNSFFGQILTAEAFQARNAGVVKEYVAVHTAAGHIYIWDVQAQTSNQIVDGAFSTSQQVQFAPLGRFLFIFDYDGGAAKYYDFTGDVTTDFMSYDYGYITDYNWLSGDLAERNVWDFKVGEQIIVWPNGVGATGTEIYDSSSADVTSIKPQNYEFNSFLYIYNGGDFLKTLDGTEYKSTQFITFRDGRNSFDFTVEGDNSSPFTIEEYYIPLDANGDPNFKSYVTRIDDINESAIIFEDQNGVRQEATVGDLSSFVDENVIMPYSPDLEPLVGRPGNKKLTDAGAAVEANVDYTPPRIYRQYVLFEMLDDGSFTTLGRPVQVKAKPSDIHVDGYTELSFTMSSASDNISKRFLCGTRWQPDPDGAFTPSSEEYSNSPLFILSEIDRNRVFTGDNTPDDRMVEGITSRHPMSGGVSDLFGPEQIDIYSIAPFTGSLLAGGYQINRPKPIPYMTPVGQSRGNIFVDISQTTQLSNNMALAFQYEYTDGRRSDIVETEQFLQQGTVVESETQVCEQTKAHASHEVTGATTSDGDIEVEYEGDTVTVDLNTTDHNTTGAVADAIANAVSNDPDILIDAEVVIGSEVRYTERRFGESFNGNPVTLTLTGGSGDPGVTFDTQSPSLADAANPTGTAAKGYMTPTANQGTGGKTLAFGFDGEDSNSNTSSISSGDSLSDIADKLLTLVNDVPNTLDNWSAYIDQRPGDGLDRVVIESGIDGDLSYNDLLMELQSESSSDLDYIVIEMSGPDGSETKLHSRTNATATHPTSGAVEPCKQAIGAINISSNNLASGETEDHTLTFGSLTTDPVTIADTDTLGDIADKYLQAMFDVREIDIMVRGSKQGGTPYEFRIYHRQFGTVGNGKEVSVSGAVDVDLDTEDLSGGTDGDAVASGTAETVSANRVQIHSLNQLVSKIYVLGRTTSGDKEFHPIRECSITDPEAHGMVIELPNTAAEVDDIEGNIYNVPSEANTLETIELSNWMVIGTPFQQFQISTQEQIVDQSDIRRVMPVDFAADTTVMRYRVMIFTDRNIQMGYLVDQTTSGENGARRTFESDFEIVFAGMRTTAREGISDVFGQIIFPTRKGMYAWPRDGSPQMLFDVRRYRVSGEETLKDVLYNQDHGEFWFIYPDSELIAYDSDSGSARRMAYSGLNAPAAGAFFGDKLYISSGTELMETDIPGQTTDEGGDPVQAVAETTHIGSELTQMRLLELTVGGQNFDVAVDVDLQPERFEGDPDTWSDSFNADKSLPGKTLKMHGESFQIQAMAVMPRIRLTWDAAGSGRLAHVILKSVATDNRGRARV